MKNQALPPVRSAPAASAGRPARTKRLPRITGLALAALTAGALVVTGCGSSSDSSKKPAAAGPKVPGTIKASAFVTGDKEGLAKLRSSGVWCRWVGDHVELRIAFRNRLSAHVTVHIQPNYRLANAGLHGDGLTSQKDVGIDAGTFRAWFADLGAPDGITGHPTITTCAPEINGVDLG